MSSALDVDRGVTPRPPEPDPPPARPSRLPSLPSLTGLRFFAAVLVFFFHASLVDPPQNPFADPAVSQGYMFWVSKAGWAGVTFFFVLSGFVLTWSSRPGDTVGGFWRRRLLKIVPAHVVTWAAAMILFAGAESGVGQWLPNLLLVHSWFPDHDTFISVNPPSWSLCSELLFYLCFPLIIRGVRRIRENRLWAWAALMVGGMVAVQLVTMFLAPASTPTPEGFPVSVWQFWFGYNFPPVRLFEFTLGMIVARVVAAGRWPRVPGGLLTAAALAAAGYGLALVVPWLFGLNVATIVPIVVLVATTARGDVEGRGTFLRSRTMIWLGEVSFGFYLVQYVVMYTFRHATGTPLYSTAGGVGVLALMFALSLLFGWLVHILVERPVMLRWGRSRSRPRSGAASPESSPAPAGRT